MALPPIGNKDPVVERLKAEGQLDRNSGTNSIKSLKKINLEGFDKLANIMTEQLAFDKSKYRQEIVKRAEEKNEARSKAKAALGAAGAAATADGTISSADAAAAAGGKKSEEESGGISKLLKAGIATAAAVAVGKVFQVKGEAERAGEDGQSTGASIIGSLIGGSGQFGEDITDFVDDSVSQLVGVFGDTIEITPERKKGIESRLDRSGKLQQSLFRQMEEIDEILKKSNGKDLEAVEKRKELEKQIADSREVVARDKNILVRKEMAVLEKERKAIESKKELTAEDEKRVEELEAQRQKLKESSDYQKDIGDKVADVGNAISDSFSSAIDGVADVGNTISDSFSSAIDGLGDFFSSKRSTSGQMKTRKVGGGFARPEGTSSGGQMSRTAGRIEEITGFNQDSIDALNAVPMDGNRVTGFSIMQRNKLRQMRNRTPSSQEITGFSQSNLDAMNAVPMRGNEITGFSINQRNQMRNRNRTPLSQEITGFSQDSIDALNAVPMDGNRVTGFSIMQRNKLRQMRNRKRAIPNEEITGFTSAALAKMNAVPMRGNEITGFSMMQRNRMRKFNQGTLGNGGELLQDFGDGTPVMLHGKEAVLTEEQLEAMFTKIGGAKSLMKSNMGSIPESIAGAIGRNDGAEAAQMRQNLMERMSDENIAKIKEQTGIKPEHFEEVLKQPTRGKGDKYDKKVLRFSNGTTLQYKPHDGTFIHSGGFGRLTYNSHGDLINYSTPTMAGMKLSKNLVSGDITTSYRTKAEFEDEEGPVAVGVKLNATMNRQGELMGGGASFRTAGVTIGGNYTTEAGGGGLTSGSENIGIKYKMGDLTIGAERRRQIGVDDVETATTLTNLSYAQSPTEMFRRENESPPVIIGGSTSNVNNVTKQYSSAKPHARNQDSSLRLARAAGA